MTEVAYKNNDIILKYMSEAFKDTALDFYGLNTAKIKAVIPTELPVLDVSEEIMDFVFLLQDNSYLHLEFQTTSSQDNLTRFLLYDARLFKKVAKDVNTAVIYSGEVKKASDILNTGSITYKVSNVYMNNFDGDKIFIDLKNKIESKEKLNDIDKLNLIFLPLMKSRINKNEVAINAIELASEIEDDDEKMLYIGAIVGISDKFIDKEYVEKLKEKLKMTRVGIELKKDGIQEGKIEDAINFLKLGVDEETVAKGTGLPIEKIRELKGKYVS